MKHLLLPLSALLVATSFGVSALGVLAQAETNTASTSPATTIPAAAAGAFTNPLFENGADPWLEYFDGNYYLTTTTWTSQLVMRKSPTLAGLATATPVYVWSDTDPKRCCNFWAFEFHRLKGPNGYRWYLMYTAGQDGTLDHQHLNVLESAGDDPMGPYQYKAAMMPDSWNIDGSYLQHNGKLYLLYSQWQGDEQLNLIAQMDNPWTLTAGKAHQVLTRPVLDWETSGRKVTEGAAALTYQGRTFVTYSASFCDTPDYKLGLLELVGEDALNPAHWKKHDQPVFSRTEQVFGPGHNGFFKSPDGKEQWLIYHGNDKASQGCGATRSLRAQKFDMDKQGFPQFGKPLAPGVQVARPSGEQGPRVGKVQGLAYQLRDKNSGQCLSVDDKGQTKLSACQTANRWQPDAMATDAVRLLDKATDKVLGAGSDQQPGSQQLQPWRDELSQQWQLKAAADGWLTLTNQADAAELRCGSGQTQCGPWQLVPDAVFAVVSQQSGKVLSAAGCSAETKDRVTQQGWRAGSCQQWQATIAPVATAGGAAGPDGSVQLKSLQQPELCLAIRDDAVVPGAALEQSSCAAKTARWQLQPQSGGGWVLLNAYSKQVLDLPSCGLADNTALAQAPANRSACQIFHLRAVK
ncbi:family 43 glycosylhydrolase [Rheinheimera tilapiae]|uniref:Family 43 glycosylhydrolase n=1 Tax=Rheinheimera tilapiae TaxID=875043 RepID=A0ABV6BB92_9GAMM